MRIYDLVKGIDLRSLDPLQRVLLVTDGTVTDTIEAIFLEPIELIKLDQRMVETASAHALLEANGVETIIERRILLRGSRSGTNYVYAVSHIAADRLPAEFRVGLTESDLPLGRLWVEHRLETFKEFVSVRFGTDDPLPPEFAASSLLVRTYRVYSGRRPVMVITEHIPSVFPPVD